MKRTNHVKYQKRLVDLLYLDCEPNLTPESYPKVLRFSYPGPWKLAILYEARSLKKHKNSKSTKMNFRPISYPRLSYSHMFGYDRCFRLLRDSSLQAFRALCSLISTLFSIKLLLAINKYVNIDWRTSLLFY